MLDKDQIWEMVRQDPKYQDGRISEERAAEVVEYLHAHQDEIAENFMKAELHRALIGMVNRGEAEYDPVTDRYRVTKPRT